MPNKHVAIVCAILLLQGGLFYGKSSSDGRPLTKPLALIPTQFGEYHFGQEGVVDPETQAVLRADDTLSRTYILSNSYPMHLFIAYFESQRTGQTPHSPKNCLPGNGWVMEVADTIPVSVPALNRTIEVNRYVVAKGDNRSVVVYWYQSHGRVVASEYKAKIYVVADAIRYHRTDTAIVKITVPVVNGDYDRATQVAVGFAQQAFPAFLQYFPS